MREWERGRGVVWEEKRERGTGGGDRRSEGGKGGG